jgi:hypothetical protein
MNPVNILFGKEPNWKATIKLLTEKKNLKDDMKNYDISQVTPVMLKKMQVYTKNPEYKPEVLKNINASCPTIAIWVLAVEKTAILHL